MKGYLVYNEEMGVFIEEFLGMGFWSEMEAGGQTDAYAFALREEARLFIEDQARNTGKEREEFRVIEAETDNEGYVSREKCAELGIPLWEVNYYCQNTLNCSAAVGTANAFCSHECEKDCKQRRGIIGA